MLRCAALLRGVNVGRGNRIAMADLRAVVDGLGHRRAVTLLASGNVVFDTDAVDPVEIAAELERALAASLGLSTRIFLRTAAEMTAILDDLPGFAAETDPSRLLVMFLANPAARVRCAALADIDWGRERLALGGAAAYLCCPDGLSGGRLADAVMAAVKSDGTGRNLATVRKLHGLLTAP